MADKEHAEWAANRKERKEALKNRLKTPPPPAAAPPEERPKSGGGDHDENERISLGM